MTPASPLELTTVAMLLLLATVALANQVVFAHGVHGADHLGPSVPHRWFSAFDVRANGDDDKPPEGMELISLSVKGKNKDRVNLAIFADGCELPSKRRADARHAEREG